MTISHARSLQQLVDGMLAFVAIFSRDGRLLEANHFALTAGAESPEHIYGKHVSEIEALSHSAESRAQVVSIMERVTSGQTVREELRVRLAGRRLAVIDTLAIPLVDSAGRIDQIGMVGIEVTAQKDDAALSKLNRQLRMLSSCNQAMMRIGSETELLQQICSIIVTEGTFRFAWVGRRIPTPRTRSDQSPGPGLTPPTSINCTLHGMTHRRAAALPDVQFACDRSRSAGTSAPTHRSNPGAIARSN